MIRYNAMKELWRNVDRDEVHIIIMLSNWTPMSWIELSCELKCRSFFINFHIFCNNIIVCWLFASHSLDCVCAAATGWRWSDTVLFLFRKVYKFELGSNLSALHSEWCGTYRQQQTGWVVGLDKWRLPILALQHVKMIYI